MKPQTISAPNAPKAVGPYSHGVRVGDFLFCSGQIPLDPASGNLVPGGIEEQTRRVLSNIKILLESQGLNSSNVIKTTVFMVDLGEFSSMNTIYGEFFEAPFPARSTIQVSALPKGARIEIEIVAHYSTP